MKQNTKKKRFTYSICISFHVMKRFACFNHNTKLKQKKTTKFENNTEKKSNFADNKTMRNEWVKIKKNWRKQIL